MAMAALEVPCDFCGQAVQIKQFTLLTTDGLQHFCCAGCLCIYQLLNNDKLLPNPNSNQNKNEDV
jgi:hypothetical protein